MSNTCPKCGTTIEPVAGRFCPRCAFLAALNCEDAPAAARPLGGAEALAPGGTPVMPAPAAAPAAAGVCPPAPGRKVTYVGDYELLEIIARGGMGVVYRARQRSLKRVVALKMLLGGGHADEEFRQRFQQEAEMAARLHHPNIVPIFEVGEHEGLPYYSMEYVEGSNLAQFCHGKPLAARAAAGFVQTAATAVDYAHCCAVLHRDLKPSNILIGRDGRLRLTDFGLARPLEGGPHLTGSGAVLGTPGYLPPEQASTAWGPVGVRSDVYALGGVLYHLLTGRPPFAADSVAETLRLVLETAPVPPRALNPEAPRDLETICLKCLARSPLDRYGSAAEVARELGRWLEQKSIVARPGAVRACRLKYALRRPALPLMFLLLAAAGGSLLVGLRARLQRPPSPAPPAGSPSLPNYEVVISRDGSLRPAAPGFDPNPSLHSYFSPEPRPGCDFPGASAFAAGADLNVWSPAASETPTAVPPEN